MIVKVKTFEDVASSIEDKVERVWSDPVIIRAPIELQAYGRNAVLVLPADAANVDEREKVMWITVIGAFALRGGSVRWTSR